MSNRCQITMRMGEKDEQHTLTSSFRWRSRYSGPYGQVDLFTRKYCTIEGRWVDRQPKHLATGRRVSSFLFPSAEQTSLGFLGDYLAAIRQHPTRCHLDAEYIPIADFLLQSSFNKEQRIIGKLDSPGFLDDQREPQDPVKCQVSQSES